MPKPPRLSAVDAESCCSKRVSSGCVQRAVIGCTSRAAGEWWFRSTAPARYIPKLLSKFWTRSKRPRSNRLRRLNSSLPRCHASVSQRAHHVLHQTQAAVAFERQDRFRMELDGFHRQLAMAHAHDDSVVAFGGDFEARREFF